MKKERAGKMTNSSNPVSPREDIIQKIVAIVTLQVPLHKLDVWLKRKLRIGVHELEGGQIVSGRGRRAQDRIRVEEIRAWRIFGEMGFDIIAIELADGRVLNWLDEHDDLIAILRNVAADRELPWTLA
jgi:hypothetical protein